MLVMGASDGALVLQPKEGHPESKKGVGSITGGVDWLGVPQPVNPHAASKMNTLNFTGGSQRAASFYSGLPLA